MKKFTLLVLSVFVGVSVNAQNLLNNGDFEGGNTYWFGNAFNIQCDGGNCFNFADVAVAGNPFDVNLSQVVEIVQGETYTLSFDASTDPTTANRTIIVGIGLNEAPFTADTQVANLTDTNQNFEFTFTASFGLANSRVLFDMGAETGVVVIDNVSLVIGGGTTTEPTEAAPTPPARDPNSVISIYSDAYTNVPNVVFGAFSVGTQAITDREIGGDNFKEIVFTQPDPAFLLVDWGDDLVDATAMTHFHMDYWIDTPLQTGLIANPKWSNHVGNMGETSFFELTNPVTTFAQWVSIDIPIADFDGGDPSLRDALRQFILTVVGADNGARTVFLDNIYLHQNTVLSNDDFSAVDITAYPNPVVNDLNITTSENINQITIYSILGQVVLQDTPNNNNVTLDVSQLQAGTYIARVATDSGIQSIRVIKQ